MTRPPTFSSQTEFADEVVFVVEDDASVREALSSLIRSVGARVETFGSAQEFLHRRTSNSAACLVLDVGLPGVLNGLDLQRELARLGDQIPIVFITGHGDISMSVRAMKAGAVEFLSKPFRDEDFHEAIEQALTRARGRAGGGRARHATTQVLVAHGARARGDGVGRQGTAQQASCGGARHQRDHRQGASPSSDAEDGRRLVRGPRAHRGETAAAYHRIAANGTRASIVDRSAATACMTSTSLGSPSILCVQSGAGLRSVIDESFTEYRFVSQRTRSRRCVS